MSRLTENSLEEESFQPPLSQLPSHGQINYEPRFHYVALGTRVVINFQSKGEYWFMSWTDTQYMLTTKTYSSTILKQIVRLGHIL